MSTKCDINVCFDDKRIILQYYIYRCQPGLLTAAVDAFIHSDFDVANCTDAECAHVGCGMYVYEFTHFIAVQVVTQAVRRCGLQEKATISLLNTLHWNNFFQTLPKFLLSLERISYHGLIDIDLTPQDSADYGM